jgi:hypothetical protein
MPVVSHSRWAVVPVGAITETCACGAVLAER